MFIQIGDKKFEALYAPQSWNEAHGAKFGEVVHIGKKPSIQHVGEELIEIEISIRLSEEYCDPPSELEFFKMAKSSAEVLPIITGVGVFVGHFLITKIDVGVEQTAGNGELITADVDITLKEYVPPPGMEELPQGEAIEPSAKPREPRQFHVRTEAHFINGNISKIMSLIKSVQGVLDKVRKGARSVKRGLREIKRMMSIVQNTALDTKQRVNKTKKILKRASKLPASLDEVFAYADNILSLPNTVNLDGLESGVGGLESSGRRLKKNAAPAGAFQGTKEIGS